MQYEPEVGQAVFGNPSGEYDCPEFVDALLEHICAEIRRVYWNIHQDEWDEYHIPDTTLIPLGQLAGRVSEVPEGVQIVVVCRSGNRSQEGRDILLQAGFEDVTSMAGGVSTWREAGYPIEAGP